jgi:hypothetical protein
MRHPRPADTCGVGSVASSVAITLVGAWLLVLAAGTVAIIAVVVTTALYVPLRCRSVPPH